MKKGMSIKLREFKDLKKHVLAFKEVTNRIRKYDKHKKS